MATDSTYYGGADYMALNPVPTIMTEEDKKRANRQAWGEYGTAGAIGLGVGAGQMLLSYKDTAGEVRNKEELAKLQDLESKNKLGLGADVKQEYERALMNPVRSAVGATERAESARLASAGRGSAADVVRTQRVAQDRITDAAIRAGTQIEQANITERARQRAEIEERLASESTREKQRIELAAQTIGGLATNFAKVSAADPSKARLTDGQIMQLAAMVDAEGRPVYPGLRGTLADARTLIEAGNLEGIYAKRAAGGTVPASGSSAEG